MQILGAFLFAAVLVGIPAAIGAHEVTRRFGRSDISTGAFVLGYAILLTAAFAYLMPVGRLSGGDHLLQMPGVLALSIIVGVVTGIMKRRKE